MNDWKLEFELWLRDRVSSERTIKSYLLDVSLYERWFALVNGIAFTPELMNSTDARSFRVQTLEIDRLSAATWNRRRASLGMLCSFFENQLDLQLFSMKRIPRAEEIAQAPRWLSEQDKRRVLRELEMAVNSANTSTRQERAIRDQAMIGLMIFAGLRISEVVNLRFDDFEISERKGLVNIRNGKGGMFRNVPLSKSLREMLIFHLFGRDNPFHNRFRADEFVFCGEKGAQISTRAVQKRVQMLESRLGIDGLEPHALRHTSAKSMLDAGAKLSEVQRILGHKRVTTTTRYVMPGMGDLEEAVERGEMGRYAVGVRV